MTIDEMILALVERHGFKLPEQQSSRGRIVVSPCYAEEHCYPGDNGFCNLGTFAYDVIAMEFARRVYNIASYEGLTLGMRIAAPLAHGDSAAAIKALYDAMETQ